MELTRGNPEDVGVSAERLDRLARLARGWVEQGVTPAVVGLVARRGKIVFHEAFGRQGPGPDAPRLALDSIFPLMSITKPITATVVMLLAEEGLIALNRPARDYVPEFAGPGKDGVMVHHLLTHTSGLDEGVVEEHVKRRMAESAYDLPAIRAGTYPSMYRWMVLGYDVPLSRAAGAEASYCNYGYDLLGEIVYRVSGQPLEDVARERIFRPLGMQDTDYVLPETLAARVVRRAADLPMAELLNSRACQLEPNAAGGVYSTAADLATFAQTFLNGGSYGSARILSPVTVVQMTRNQIPGIGLPFRGVYYREARWGLGWCLPGDRRVTDLDPYLLSPRAFSHTGSGGVALYVDPTYEMVIVYFSVLGHVPEGRPSRSGSDLFTDAALGSIVET